MPKVTSRKGGRGEVWQRFKLAPPPVKGLAAAKYAQQTQATAFEQARRQLPAVDCSWPETMTRELFGCRTSQDGHVWSERWAEQLSGRAADRKLSEAKAAFEATETLRRPGFPRAQLG